MPANRRPRHRPARDWSCASRCDVETE